MLESQTSVEVLPAGHPAVEAWVGSQLVVVCVAFPSFVHVMVVPTVIVMLGLPLASLKPQFEGLLHSPLVSHIETGVPGLGGVDGGRVSMYTPTPTTTSITTIIPARTIVLFLGLGASVGFAVCSNFLT